MGNKIQIKRGLKVNLPTLAIGEPGFCTDTGELYIGTSGGNQQVVSPNSPTSIDGGTFTTTNPNVSDGGTW